MAMSPNGLRLEGTLSSWNDERGFGFISSAGNGAGIFVHITAFPWSPVRPHVGEQLTFEIELTSEGKRRAKSVRPVGPASAQRPHQRKPPVIRGAVALGTIVAFVVLYLVVNWYWVIPGWVAALYLGSSAICYLAYATDKSAAAAGRWRVSESTLLTLGLLGGWPGAIVAQQVLRHKTVKTRFQFAFWGTVALNVAAFMTFSSPISDGLVGRLVGLLGNL
jgi:uncharacterized membrane protein YsdA (DUF1294 family)/cold shock CspA family protein